MEKELCEDKDPLLEYMKKGTESRKRKNFSSLVPLVANVFLTNVFLTISRQKRFSY